MLAHDARRWRLSDRLTRAAPAVGLGACLRSALTGKNCGNRTADVCQLHEPEIALCGLCRDLIEVRNAFDKVLLDLTRMEKNRDYEEIFSTLKKLREEYASRDHDGWLNRSIMSHEAHILVQEGRDAEALERLRAIASTIPPDHPEFLPNQLAIAHALEKKSDWREALIELEVGLRGMSDRYIDSAFHLFVRYALIAVEHQVRVPPVHRDLFLETARCWGIDIPAQLLADPESLGQAILFANIRWREAQDRYIALLDALRATLAPEARLQLIQAYVAQERVGYFRMMAQEMLKESAESSPVSPPHDH